MPRDSVYQRYVKLFNEQPLPTPVGPIKGRFEPYPHAAFAAMVSRLDRYVGEVYRYVQQNGLADNTLIISSPVTMARTAKMVEIRNSSMAVVASGVSSAICMKEVSACPLLPTGRGPSKQV